MEGVCIAVGFLIGFCAFGLFTEVKIAASLKTCTEITGQDCVFKAVPK